MSNSMIRGSVPPQILTMSTAQVLAVVEERDALLAWQDDLASRIPDQFDGEEGQEAVIDRWVDTLEERIRERDPAGYRWLFEGGPDPREDEEPVTR